VRIVATVNEAVGARAQAAAEEADQSLSAWLGALVEERLAAGCPSCKRPFGEVKAATPAKKPVKAPPKKARASRVHQKPPRRPKPDANVHRAEEAADFSPAPAPAKPSPLAGQLCKGMYGCTGRLDARGVCAGCKVQFA
jgi:hypothetical protein